MQRCPPLAGRHPLHQQAALQRGTKRREQMGDYVFISGLVMVGLGLADIAITAFIMAWKWDELED